MTRADVQALGDTPVTALTLYGEFRGDAVENRIAGGCVIRNRVRAPGWWGTGYTGVCLHPEQFSCWNGTDANGRTLLAIAAKPELWTEDPILAECFWIAEGIIGGRTRDRVGKATHYYALSLRQPPAWTIGAQLVARIGSTSFFAGVQ